MKFIITKTYAEMSRIAANMLSAQVILKNNSVLGLATGSTPIGIYKQLVDWYKKRDVSFADVTTVNLDEYFELPQSHAEGYRNYMNKYFFDHIDIKKEHTYIPNGMAADCNKECDRYTELIEKIGGIDMQLLGVGHNGPLCHNG